MDIDNIYVNLQINRFVCKAKKDMSNINRLIRKLKFKADKIKALIETCCKKKLVFADPLLPFGTIREAHVHCTHLQIAQANPQIQFCKRVQFFPRSD